MLEFILLSIWENNFENFSMSSKNHGFVPKISNNMNF